MTRTVIFLGPSLSAAEARALAPRAEVRPPAAVGDILALALANKPPAGSNATSSSPTLG